MTAAKGMPIPESRGAGSRPRSEVFADPTLTAPVSMSYDAESGIGSIRVPGIVKTDIKPIPNVVSGEPHRISIALPHGFEFEKAEMACGSTETSGGEIDLLKNSATHAHIAQLHLSGAGIVRA